MKTDIEKLAEQAEDIREALGSLAEGTKSLPLTPAQAERLLPFIHDTQEIALAFVARLQSVFLGIPEAPPGPTPHLDRALLARGELRCQFTPPGKDQCTKPAVGFTADGVHIACRKHGGIAGSSPYDRPPQSADSPGGAAAPPESPPPSTEPAA